MKAKIGLLPLYLELYDQKNPEMRSRVNEFLELITNELTFRGMEVISVPPARIESEFGTYIKKFEEESADAIITLHLAYSPFLESIKPLAGTKLPVIVMDTTFQYDFGPSQKPSEISYNHGIHGVQDMCNLLLRSKKPFLIEAGHWKESDLFDRIEDDVKSCLLLSGFRGSKLGRIGESFKGMGDFFVEKNILKAEFDIDVIEPSKDEFSNYIDKVTNEDIYNEINSDRERFLCDDLDESVHKRSTAVNLAVRKWIEEEGLDGFSVNFLAASRDSSLNIMPFLEAGKAMSRSIGYAGEGDVLTAGFVGCLAKVFGEVSFTEMFCPDWKGNSIFLSHMGEINVDLIDGKGKLAKKPFPYTDADDPVTVYGRFKPGEALFVNLAPSEKGYNLIIAKGIIPQITVKDEMEDTIHGWFKPECDVARFLEKYSLAGGTHHAAIVYGGRKTIKQIAGFGKIAGFDVIEI